MKYFQYDDWIAFYRQQKRLKPLRSKPLCYVQTLLVFASLVRKGGLEPPRPKALPPQGSVSTNSTTTAFSRILFASFKKEKA